MGFNIVIVGTGIAGLAAALALTRKGHNVTVTEATARLRPIGGIIALQANANRILDLLDVYEPLISLRWPIPHGPSTKSYKGEILCQVLADSHEKEYGYPADLQQVLYDAAVRQRITIRLGCLVVSVEEELHTVTAVLKGGERLNADLIVGADGIDSTIRRSIVPDAACVRDSGLDITRATIPAATVRSDPETAMFMDQIDLWCGPSSSIAAMVVRHGDQWLLGLDCCHTRSNTLQGGKGRRQDIAEFRGYFRDYAPSVQKLLSYVDEAYVWKLKEAKPETWVGKSGRLVLIGDAAHGCLPWVGQGGGMALEDAVSLAECLDRAEGYSDISKVLQAFQELRQPRCRRVQEWAERKGHRATLSDGPEQRVRDEKLRRANAWVTAAKWDKVHVDEVPEFEAPNWKAWLSGHNAVEFTNRELDKRFGRRKVDHGLGSLFVNGSPEPPRSEVVDAQLCNTVLGPPQSRSPEILT